MLLSLSYVCNVVPDSLLAFQCRAVCVDQCQVGTMLELVTWMSGKSHMANCAVAAANPPSM